MRPELQTAHGGLKEDCHTHLTHVAGLQDGTANYSGRLKWMKEAVLRRSMSVPAAASC